MVPSVLINLIRPQCVVVVVKCLKVLATYRKYTVNMVRGKPSTWLARQVDLPHHSNYYFCCTHAPTCGSTLLLSVKTHRRAATGNMRSREASGTAGGPRSLGQRPRSPAHTLAWWSARRATWPIPDQEGVETVRQLFSCVHSQIKH
jgi:hypothetical protein